MDGQHKQPPDKGKSNGMPFECQTNDDLIIKGPMMKEEPKDMDENIVSISYEHISTRLLSNPIDGIKMTEPYDFNDHRDLFDIKSVFKNEEVEEKVKKVSESSSEKGEAGQKDTVKPTSSEKKARARPSSDDQIIKNMTKAKQSNKKKTIITKIDRKQHQCSSCEYTASVKSNLKKHTRNHTGEKPFSCTHCSKRFSQKHHLQRHMRTHVAEFLFSCSNCLKGFSQNSDKLEHEAVCKVPRYECDLCNEYSTLRKDDLKRHMRVHTGKRPFRCDQCLKMFKLQGDLERHMKTHTNPRPATFKCSICYANFRQQAQKDEHEGNCKRRGYECYLCKCFNSPKKHDLVYHMRAQHTGDKPFRCEICAKCFSHKGNLDRHEKIHK